MKQPRVLPKVEDIEFSTLELRGSFDLVWSAMDVGYGGTFIYVDEDDGKIHISNECMSKKFLKHLFCKMIDQAVLDDEPFSNFA